jgi:GAF domain-containing protein
MTVEDSALNRMLAQLRDVEARETDLGVGLQTIVDSASAFFDVAGAGLMVIGGSHGLQAAVASDDAGMALEEAQERIGEGPCVDALIYDEIITTNDLASDPRYQRLAPEIVPLGVRAVLGMPVRVGGVAAATINIYAQKPHHWHTDETQALLAFANVVGTTLTTAVGAHRKHILVEQLEYALTNRVTIERATGIVMARHQVDAVTAFNVLRDRARSSRRKVTEVADDVLSEFAAEPID